MKTPSKNMSKPIGTHEAHNINRLVSTYSACKQVGALRRARGDVGSALEPAPCVHPKSGGSLEAETTRWKRREGNGDGRC